MSSFLPITIYLAMWQIHTKMERYFVICMWLCHYRYHCPGNLHYHGSQNGYATSMLSPKKCFPFLILVLSLLQRRKINIRNCENQYYVPMQIPLELGLGHAISQTGNLNLMKLPEVSSPGLLEFCWHGEIANEIGRNDRNQLHQFYLSRKKKKGRDADRTYYTLTLCCHNEFSTFPVGCCKHFYPNAMLFYMEGTAISYHSSVLQPNVSIGIRLSW